MNTPIILICGAAGSGKDTVASFLTKNLNGACVAQADPMKRFTLEVFAMTETQLWGPSECRNAEDARFIDPDRWTEAAARLRHYGPSWVRDVLPDMDKEQQREAFKALVKWFDTVATSHGMYEKERGPGFFPDYKKGAITDRILTARYVLQTLGTEWGRQFSPRMWNDYAIRIANKLLDGEYNVYDRATGATNTGIAASPDFVFITDGRFKNEINGVARAGGATVLVKNPKAKDDGAVEKAGVAGHKSEAELKGMPEHLYNYVLINDKTKGLRTLGDLVEGFAQKLRPTPTVIEFCEGGSTNLL